MERLTAASLKQGITYLIQKDADLATIYHTYGVPPLWDREPGFSTLIHIILEQQVSLASALAAYKKLQAIARPLTPATFLDLPDKALSQVGFSRQKMRYGRLLAQAIQNGDIDLSVLAHLPDAEVKRKLTTIKGIGPWTADVYLLMVLGRPNSWPVGDLALQIAVQEVKNLKTRPNAAEMMAIGEPWQPWRAVAARLLWHYYLSRR